MENIVIKGDGPGAQVTKMLLAAGCNIASQRNLEFGIMAYNTALLVWHSHSLANKFTGVQRSPKTGRNDPCPCGSGTKYKKCCIETDVTSSNKINERITDMEFDPRIIPKLWDEKATISDMSLLDKTMKNDPHLKGLRFSTEKVKKFLKKHSHDEEFSSDPDKVEEFIDQLAFQYARESGEHKLLGQATNMMIAAAKDAQNIDELRAIACGALFAMAYKSSGDVNSPLIAFIFRLSAKEALQPLTTIRNIATRLDGSFSHIDENDPDFKKNIRGLWDELDGNEKKTIEKMSADIEDDLWNLISTGKFPVGLPFATVLPFWHRAKKLQDSGGPLIHDERLIATLKESGKNMTDDDYMLYLLVLEKWIDDNQKKQSEDADNVRMMRMLARAKAISSFIPHLMLETCKSHQFIFLDDKEAEVVNSWEDLSNMDDDLLKYADFLESRGYLKIAERTRKLIELH